MGLMGFIIALFLLPKQQKSMSIEDPSTRAQLRAPKAAAIAGIVFSVLLIISLVLVLITHPRPLSEGYTWISTHAETLLLALNLVPFSGIAFLWFMGVVHDRVAERLDRFLITVSLGSGLLFLALLFVVAAISGSSIAIYLNPTKPQLNPDFYEFGSTVINALMNTYILKMSGVYMFSTSTLFMRTQMIAPGLAWLGYGLALFMLLRIAELNQLGWVSLLFPLWVLLISVYILIDNYRGNGERN